MTPRNGGATAVAPLRLTSLAAIKRACQVGVRLDTIRAQYQEGGSGSHMERMVAAPPRPIVKAQTNALALRGIHRDGGKTWDPDGLGWLYWPKAADVTPHGDDTFTIDFGGFTATYRVIA